MYVCLSVILSFHPILKHFRNVPFYILLFLPHGWVEDIFWSYFMSVHNEKGVALIGFDHVIRFDVIMTFVFSTICALNVGVYLNLKTNSFSW